MIVLIDVIIYCLYYLVQKNKYIFQNEKLVVFNNSKQTTINYHDISEVKILRLLIDDDFSALVIISYGIEFKIYMPYFKAKRIKKIISNQ